MGNCPKCCQCSASICPVDVEWRIRVHLKRERVCCYLTEYSTQHARGRLRGSSSIALSVYLEVLLKIFPDYGWGLVEQFKESIRLTTIIGFRRQTGELVVFDVQVPDATEALATAGMFDISNRR